MARCACNAKSNYIRAKDCSATSSDALAGQCVLLFTVYPWNLIGEELREREVRAAKSEQRGGQKELPMPAIRMAE